jgi:hypothetical protein
LYVIGDMSVTRTSAVRTALAAWRAATPRHFGYTSALALGWSVVTIATATVYFTQGLRLTPSINAVLSMQFNGFAVLLAVLVVDHVMPPLARRAMPYAAAVALGVALGTTAMWVVSQRVLGLRTAYGSGIEPFDTFAFRHGSHALVVCGLVTFVYVSARWAAERRAALRRLQLERVDAEKQLVESTFAVTRSRVDPAELQTTLARIDALVESRPAEADALLRDLITSLRAAIPASPDAASRLAPATHPMA